jgi:putative transposase
VVNAKRVHRIMRDDNLLCLRRRKFLVTTDSRHSFPSYPNLAGELQLTNVNQLWIADITYIRLQTEFVYLAVILDAFSRRVIGWALDRTLEAKLTLKALQMTLSRRSRKTGLVRHSDRGVQYAADDYTSLLTQHGIQISMSRKGNPYDNARTESSRKSAMLIIGRIAQASNIQLRTMLEDTADVAVGTKSPLTVVFAIPMFRRRQMVNRE